MRLLWFWCLVPLVTALALLMAGLAVEGVPLFKSDDSIMSVVTALLTPGIALLAGIAAFAGYVVNRTAARATRFQKGVEMLGGANTVTQMGGIQVLSDVASEDARHIPATFLTLVEYIREDGRTFKTGYDPFVKPPVIDEGTSFPMHVGTGTAEAMSALARLVPKARRETGYGRARAPNGPSLVYPYIFNSTFLGDDFSGFEISPAVFTGVVFQGCDFDSATVMFVPLAGVTFTKCNLRNARLTVRHPTGKPTLARVPGLSTLNFDGGDWTGCLVNGMPVDKWLVEAKREDAPPFILDGHIYDL